MTDDVAGEALTGLALLGEAVSSKPGGEVRVEQERMVTAVESALENRKHLLIQAGTGVGKTLGYLLPLVASGERAVISTATNQLAQQVFDIDLPLVDEMMQRLTGKPVSYSLMKGRSNYLCLAKLDELTKLDDPNSDSGEDDVTPDLMEGSGFVEDSKSYSQREALSSKAEEAQAIFEWAKTTTTGERFEAPSVSDETWAGFSSTSAECPGKRVCPFGETCFTEQAKEDAIDATILVTNHALTGLDLAGEDHMFGERGVLIVDEAHEMDNYFTRAWGGELTTPSMKRMVSTLRTAVPANELKSRELIDELDKHVKALEEELNDMDQQRFDAALPPRLNGILRAIDGVISSLTGDITRRRDKASGGAKIRAEMALSLLNNTTAMIGSLTTIDSENVRWVKHDLVKGEKQGSLQIGPLRVGPRLMQVLEERDMSLIATSATVTVGGEFEIPVRNLALNENIIIDDAIVEPRAFDALDVGTPFDYRNQAIRFIPSPQYFPAPVGQEREEHSSAVIDFVEEATNASKGRALILSSTTREARKIGEHLKRVSPHRVLVQGDMPAGPIVDAFVEDVDSILVGTMGFWHGLNAPGKTCSLVVIDKIPFVFMDDPLLKARMDDVQQRGGNGFMDIYVASANVMLSQGVGRLIRHTTDRGVVAILDSRLRTKPYGRKMVASLPDMWETSDESIIMNSLRNI